MNILFLGNFEAPFSSENYYRKTLEELGHTVIPLQEGKATGRDISNQAAHVDCFFWVHTHGWRTLSIDEALIVLKVAGVPTFGYHLDLYMGLQREPQLNEYVTKVDYFFTVDKLMADWLNENTKTKGFYLPAGIYQGECHISRPDYKKYPHEIIFTGSKSYHPEYPYRPQLIEWLQKTYGSRFAHYGGGGKPSIRGNELNTLYASARIVIGDTLCKDFMYPYYFSDRLFEVPGRGGFMIFPWIKGIDFMFSDGELQTYKYGDFEGLRHTIEHFLSHNEQREKIMYAGHHRAKTAHTYAHRMKLILATLKAEKHEQNI